MKKGILLISIVFLFCLQSKGQAYNISTIAGDGYGDGQPAISQSSYRPCYVVTDAMGNIYISDENQGMIRKISTNGILTTVAGNGVIGFSGDGGAATAAELSYPEGIAVDDSGNIYIADVDNERIRKVSTNGIISTFAGKGSATVSGDGGPAVSAGLFNPNDVAVDHFGNVYISEGDSFRIRKVNTKGIISTYAGTTVRGYYGDGGLADMAEIGEPMAIVLDKSGDLYISDYGYSVIRKVDSNGIISTFAGDGNPGFGGDGGPATAAKLLNQYELSVDASGNVYIADLNNYRIRQVNSSGIITTIAGNGTSIYAGDGSVATATGMQPNGVAVDYSGNVFITDLSSTVRKINTSGIITTIAGNGTESFSGDNGPATAAQLYNPIALTTDSLGDIYVCDLNNSRIRKISTNGIIYTIAGKDSSGTSGNGGPATAAKIFGPYGIVIDHSGNIIFSEETEWVRKIDTAGIISTVAGTGNQSYNGDGIAATLANLSDPSGVAVDDSDNIYVADSYTNRIRKINSKGIISTVAGDGTAGFTGDGTQAASGYSEINKPAGITFDGSGNLYIADQLNNRIRKVGTNGIISTVAGGGTSGPGDGGPATAAQLYTPFSVVVDKAGNIYIANSSDASIRKVNTSGIISTIAGNRTQGFSGDGGLSTRAELNIPEGMALDTAGNVFIADYSNNRIRELITLQCKGGFDLTGNLSVCIDTPGFSNASIQACIFNNMCQAQNGTLKLVLDTAIHIFSTVSDSAAHVSGDTLIWNYRNLSDTGKIYCVTLNGSVSSLPSGDSVFASMFITPLTSDLVPGNNNVTYWVKPFPYNCVGLPFDPNEKSVFPEGTISATQQLTYTIHFQNTGTSVAHNVVVIDTLSPNVDPTTLKIISSSSELTTSIIGGNTVRFTFSGIDLPDTATSKITSIGVVQYTINPIASVSPGAVIKNTAGIYFDANAEVKTNTTINKIAGGPPLSMQNIISPMNIAVFPNPFTTETSIVFNTIGKHYIEVDDITGRKIESMECGGKQYELNRNGLAQGIYFIRAYDEGMNYTVTAKIIVE